MSSNKVVMVDNYDSFTYNLVQYLGELDAEVEVVRNDQVTVSDIKKMRPDRIVISPGPCTPLQAGISVDTVLEFAGVCPILGVCLGHQSIAHAFGGRIVRAKRIMHGKTSMVYHHNDAVFSGLSNPFEATRYHSLVIDQGSLPNCFEITAWTENESGDLDEIMGVRHRQLDVEGVQFHPESILTAHGHDLLRNFLANEERYSRP